MHTNIGLLGCGTVGASVLKGFSKLQKCHPLLNKTKIQRVLIRSRSKEREEKNRALFTFDSAQILNDTSIGIVIETMGGLEPAFQYVCQALEKGKQVVTANKLLLSEKGEELFRVAKSNGVQLRFEAAVAGAIPIVSTISEKLRFNDVQQIEGILNGTSNFILSKMTEENWDFQTALKKAQVLGFAEKNPSMDLSGMDTAQKLKLLVACATGEFYALDQFPIEGIEKIEAVDIEYAQKNGFRIKLLARFIRSNKSVQLSVAPTMLPKTHFLADVEREYNGLTVHDGVAGSLTLQGKGAGGMPTAAAILYDVVDIVRGGFLSPMQVKFPSHRLALLAPHLQRSRHYLRMTVVDKVGQIAKIGKIFAEENISVASMLQPASEPGKRVDLIFTLHSTDLTSLGRATQKLENEKIVSKPITRIQIEDERIN
jgi:homoserine dehydrogenase